MAATPKIIFDPYFDSERNQLPAAGAPITAQTEYGYHDPGDTVANGGESLVGRLRPGPRGTRGTVIPHATLEGIPQGTAPHDVEPMVITYDPHVAGQSFHVKLGNLTKEKLKDAIAQAALLTPPPTTLPSQRLRGSAILALAAGEYDTLPAGISNEPKSSAPTVTPSLVVPTTVKSKPAMTSSRQQVSPLTAFNMVNQQRVQQTEQASQAEAAFPQIKVQYEIEQFGVHEAYYHDVLVEHGVIVLVLDTRYKGPRYFPPTARETQPPMALRIGDMPEVYSVLTTGIRFTHEHYEFCVLMVDQVATLQPDYDA